MRILIDFKNGFGCIHDKVESYEIENNFLKIKFENGCVRNIDYGNIEHYEVKDKGKFENEGLYS